jgi:hypothetical protein
MTLEKLAEEVGTIVARLGTLSAIGEKYASDGAGEDSQKSVAVIAYGLYDNLVKEAAAHEVCVPALIEKLANIRGKEVSHDMRLKLAAASIADDFLTEKIAEDDTLSSHYSAVQLYGREFCAELLKEVM